MPAYAAKLSDQEIADVATYIRNSWGNAAPAVTPGEVKRARRAKHVMASEMRGVDQAAFVVEGA